MDRLDASAASSLTLYDFPLSGNCHKIRLMLSLLGLPYKTVSVDMAQREHKLPAFLALNPRGQVPVLQDGEVVVWDSMAILAYLASKYAPEYLPADPVGLARTFQWLAVSENELLYGLARARAYFRFRRFDIPLEEVQALGIAGLRVLESGLAKSVWLAADRPTIADIACYPYVKLAGEGGISISSYPAIKAWLARLESLPSFAIMPAGELIGNMPMVIAKG
ncbi:glutathione S-transferase family protein [Thermithiobacillus plumbiphilus]|uniref:Glutathione S-transferase family protein n=1 Tax=Thermithiobacillus plumbiphilus TaxID=1729899 RepID=A0ABU9DA31_9PROT